MLYLRIVDSNGFVVFIPRRRWLSAMLGCDSLREEAAIELWGTFFFLWHEVDLFPSVWCFISKNVSLTDCRASLQSYHFIYHWLTCAIAQVCSLLCMAFEESWVYLFQKHKESVERWQTGLTWGWTRSSKPTRAPGEGEGEAGVRPEGGEGGQRGEGESLPNLVLARLK